VAVKPTPAALLLQRLAPPRVPPSRKLPIALPLGRDALPDLCVRLGYTRGAEVGVWKGAYSAKFCAAGLHMLCVDPWLSYPEWQDTKNSLPPDEQVAFMAAAHAEALARLGPLDCEIVRAFSADAAKAVPDGSLDFVYIDGNHVEAAVRADLAAWSPKVRRGGLVAGHDYRIFGNKPTIHVVEAVRAHVAAHAIAPWYLLAGDKTPSFLWGVA
jgi:methyltransferase family protein